MEKVGPRVEEALQVAKTARVVVALKGDEDNRSPPSQRATTPAEIARLQQTVLATLEPSDFQIVLRYQSVPALVGMVTATGLSKLIVHPAVVRIDLDVHAQGTGGGAR